MDNKKTLVILDANSFVHSSFHGYQPQLDIRGKDQRVLYGIINALVTLTYNIPSIDMLYIVFDPEDGSLYRKSIYPEYKANRPPHDPDLTRQKLVAKQVIEDFIGIPCVSYSGYEADDIIGSLSELYRHEYRVIVVSPDKDMAQLIKDDVVLFKKVRTKTEKGYKAINSSNVYEEYGVHAHQIPDWLALMGDEVDNLPGLHKVGKKRASTILNQYPSIEHLISVIHEHENESFRNTVKDNQEMLCLVKKLATIVCDLPIESNAINGFKKAESIRTHKDYNSRLIKLKNHFAWPNHFIDMFL